MSSLIKIKNNDKYKLIETKKIKDINSTFNIYQHKITKTKIIFINSKDKEKSFLVSFKTPSHNSKGIQHILEHSILRGSKKYDFGHRESFTEILRNSLLTNINASTHKSYTNYYFSTFVESEFFKVMDIYTDGVFLPKVINNENLFKQEGWRYEKNKEGKIIFNGVVFNEMKGYYSDSWSISFKERWKYLMSDTEYKYNSGGNPNKIPDLTYREFVEYYKKYYHPTNATFIIYGDIDNKKILKKLDENFLSYFKKGEKAKTTKLQKKFLKPKRKNIKFLSSMPEKSSMLSLSFLMDKIDNSKNNMLLNIFSNILVEETSRLYKNIMDSNLVSDFSVYFFDGYKQGSMHFEFQGINYKNRKKIENIFFKSLQEMFEEGIEKNIIEKIINKYEEKIYRAKYNRGGLGLNISEKILPAIHNDFSFFDIFELTKKLKWLKEEFKKPKIFEKLIKNKLLINKSYLSLTLKADLKYDQYKILYDKLQKINSSQFLIKKAEKQIEKFQNYQNEKNFKISKILPPKTTELPKKIEDIDIEKREKDNIQYYFKKINDPIQQVNFYFNANFLEKNEIQYWSLLEKIFTRLSPEENRDDFLKQRKKIMDINLLPKITLNKNNKINLITELDLSFLDRNEERVYFLINKIFKNLIFDKKILKEVIKSEIEIFKNSQLNFPRKLSLIEAKSQLLDIGKIENLMGGLDYYYFLLKIEKEFEKKEKKIIQNFNKIYKKLFNLNNLKISHSSKTINLNIHQKLNIKKEDEVGIFKFKKKRENIGFIHNPLDTNINTLANLLPENIKKDEIIGFAALSNFLSYDYLWQKIREQGGAYGAGYSVNLSTKFIYLASYFDSRIKGTYFDFNNISDFLLKENLDDEKIQSIIVGGLNNYFPSKTNVLYEAKKAVYYELNETSVAEKNKEINTILNLNKEKIRKDAKILKKILKNSVKISFGNKKNIEKNKKLFNKIKKI